MSKAASDLEVDALEQYQADLRHLRATFQAVEVALVEAKSHLEKVQGSFKDKAGVITILESQRTDVKTILDLFRGQAGEWQSQVDGFAARIAAQI